MELHYKEFEDEVDTLVEFLTSDTWDFLGESNPNPERIRENYLCNRKVFKNDNKEYEN